MEFGERLIEASESLGFNQSYFSDKIVLAPQSLARYEKNKVKPSVNFLTKLTDMFNINSNWLLTGKGSILIDQLNYLPIAHNKEKL
jgi:transcriptional regulator with XRE-family HTH domain